MNKKKILLIEDEKEFACMLKLNLEASGEYEVFILPDAKDLLVKTRKIMPEIILLDLLLPSIGGLEVCQMLNSEDSVRGIPVVVISALGKEIDKQKAYKLGAVDYFVKPLNMDKLLISIKKYIMYKKL
jgi:DNA-binding response OmpR family regulator